MKNFKERLYNHEATPPPEIWDHISAELHSTDSRRFPKPGLRRRSKFVFYGLTAAASLIIIFISSVLFNKPTQNNRQKSSLSSMQPDNVSSQKIKDAVNLNNNTLEAIIKSPKDKKSLEKNYAGSLLKGKKYLTIEGPEPDCQPVKISSKAATLIESADNDYPPKPVWNKKIDKWKQIMLSNPFSSTSTALLDIARLSSSLDNNE